MQRSTKSENKRRQAKKSEGTWLHNQLLLSHNDHLTATESERVSTVLESLITLSFYFHLHQTEYSGKFSGDTLLKNQTKNCRPNVCACAITKYTKSSSYIKHALFWRSNNYISFGSICSTQCTSGNILLTFQCAAGDDFHKKNLNLESEKFIIL